MANDFFQDDGNPPNNGSLQSSPIRALFAAVETGFDKLCGLTGNGGKTVKVNAGGTALEVSKVTITEPATGATLTIPDGVILTGPAASGTTATLAGAETLINKTLTSPTLTTPALGTPASGVLTNCTGTAAGLSIGGNAATATTAAAVTNGGALNTPASGTLTNCTGLPAAGVSGTALVAGAIGTTVQAYSANLTTYAGTAPTAAGLAILDDANAAAQRTTLGAAASGANSDITSMTGITGIVNLATGGDIASAATINLATATGNTVHITGATATSAVTMTSGQWMRCVADGAWPLTYHATTNRISGGVNVTLSEGDTVDYFYDGTVVYGNITRKDGRPTKVEASSVATNGYQTFPGGLIVQWGVSGLLSGGSIAVTFPVAFPNAAFMCVGTLRRTAVATVDSVTTSTPTTSGVTLYCSSTYDTSPVHWIAFGN